MDAVPRSCYVSDFKHSGLIQSACRDTEDISSTQEISAHDSGRDELVGCAFPRSKLGTVAAHSEVIATVERGHEARHPQDSDIWAH